MKTPDFNKGAVRGRLPRLVRFLVFSVWQVVIEYVHRGLKFPVVLIHLGLRPDVVKKFAAWTLERAASGARHLENGNRLVAKTLRAGVMERCRVALHGIVAAQEHPRSELFQRVAFERAVLLALIFKVANRLASLFQDSVCHLLSVEQSLLEIRKMLPNIEKRRVEVRLVGDGLDGLHEIHRFLDRIDSAFDFRYHGGAPNFRSNVRAHAPLPGGERRCDGKEELP